MFDNNQLADASNISPNKYLPKEQYSLPPRKTRGVGGIDNGRTSTKKVLSSTTTKKQYNGRRQKSPPTYQDGPSQKGFSGGAVAGGALAGAAVGAGGYALYDNMNEDQEEEIANIEAKQEDIYAQQAQQEEEA